MSDDLTLKTTAGKTTDAAPSQELLAPSGPTWIPQMDPGQREVRLYTFTDGLGTVVAQVLVPRISGAFTSGGPAYAAGVEYWYQVSSTPPAGGSVRVTWTEHVWTDSVRLPSTLSFRMAQAPAWASASTAMPATSATIFVNNDVRLVIAWGLSRSTSGAWTGNLTWFNTTGQSDVFRGVMPHGGVLLTGSTTVDTRAMWFRAVVPPT